MSADNEAEWVEEKNVLWFGCKHSQFFSPAPMFTPNKKLTWLVIVKFFSLSSFPQARSSLEECSLDLLQFRNKI